MGEALCKVAIVRENKQTFALRVETANIEEPRQFRRQEIEDGVTRVRVLTRGDEAFRFVQENVEKPLGWPNEFAIDLNVITFAGLHAEIRTRLTVYRNTPSRDQFIAMPARTDASGRKEAI
jgi:hypothetical protein